MHYIESVVQCVMLLNPLSPELSPICYLLALLGAHHFLHVSRIRVNASLFCVVITSFMRLLAQVTLVGTVEV
jgi:hypothetical protein